VHAAASGVGVEGVPYCGFAGRNGGVRDGGAVFVGAKADRGGRILVDTGRNAYSATFASGYAVRAKAGAPVSAPCTWTELERSEVGPRSFTLRNMRERVEAAAELWAELPGRPLGLEDAIERRKGMTA
jgi:bifunctional non-homologous end joining protein LigD